MHAQPALNMLCQTSAVPIVVRGEGASERLGDVQLQCFGGQPNAVVSGNLTVFISVNFTNRVNALGEADALITIDNGAGPIQANVAPRYLNTNSLVWQGLTFQLNSQGQATLRIVNLRAAAFQFGPDSTRTITATLAFNAGQIISIQNNNFAIGTVIRSLFSSYASRMICAPQGSPNPTISFQESLSNRSLYSAARITEGFPSAFGPRTDFANFRGESGYRVMARFSGIPPGSRIFMPDAVVGFDGLQATSTGDFGKITAGGTFQAGSGALLLIRVINADPNGSGGSFAVQPPQFGSASFDSMSEVSILADGTANAVYEVVSSNNNSIQSVILPAFLGLPAGVVGRFIEIAQDVIPAPLVPGVTTAATAPVPRFVPTFGATDCTRLGDCFESYFPRLSVNVSAIDAQLAPGQVVESRFFTIANTGGGAFLWQARVEYRNGENANWLRINVSSGINRETVRVDLVPGGLSQGIYEGTIVIDAGSVAGFARINVVMRVASTPPPTPRLTAALNAASLQPALLVPGSLTRFTGERLSGGRVDFTIGGIPSRIVLGTNNFIIVQVPFETQGLPNAFAIVTVDGGRSEPLYVGFIDAAPAIFQGGVLNVDYAVNTAQNPARAGDQVIIFATGLPVTGVYTARLGDRVIEQPLYAGVAPGLLGIFQFNVAVPDDMPSMMTDAFVCGGPAFNRQTCSQGAPVSIVERPPAPTTNPQ
jgi:uncharacterized protein (TIGR03437 family)